MKNCLIYQPCGLGDLIWIQPIVDKFIDQGYSVYLPVIELYYDMLKRHVEKPNLIWVRETEDFPMKPNYGGHVPLADENNVYVPLSFSNYYLKNCSVMISKYYFTGTPITNWHKSINIKRDLNREKQLMESYNIDISKPYTIFNMTYGTPPNHVVRETKMAPTTDIVINMNFEKDKANGFTLFDWIGAIEQASEIHTVETSLCYLVDMYAKSDKLFMYEKRREQESPTYYNLVNLVYRNANWSYLN
jgi:hypothetical protein